MTDPYDTMKGFAIGFLFGGIFILFIASTLDTEALQTCRKHDQVTNKTCQDWGWVQPSSMEMIPCTADTRCWCRVRP